METPLLLFAANKRNMLTFEAYNTPQWFVAVEWLTTRGFVRETEGDGSQSIIGLDEGIMPSFVRDKVSLAAGWDNWSGNYLIAECEEADSILLELAKHVGSKDIRSVA